MIDEKTVKQIINYLNDYSEVDNKPFTILPPSKGEKNKLRIYAEGGLFAKIRIEGDAKSENDLELLSSGYSKYAGSDADSFLAYIEKAEKDTNSAISVILDRKFIDIALKCLKKKWKKKAGTPKEKDVQNEIVKNYMMNNSKWKVISQEAQFKGNDFKGGEFSSTTSEKERFDLIVMSDRGIGFIELKVNNENCDNLNSHYEHMQYVKKNPKVFLEDVKRRFEIIEKYGLWPQEEMKLFSTEKIWFGFLFIKGGKDRCKTIIENKMSDKLLDDKETMLLYYDGAISELDINKMVPYDEFILQLKEG